MGKRFCGVEDCVAVARKDGLCWAHYKRKQRGVPYVAPLRARLGTWDACVEAWHEYQDAEGDDAYRAARKRCQRAMEAWVMARRGGATCPPAVGG